MNDEIKEIYLSNLEWTKTHDDMGGVMGNIVFKDNMSYEEYNKLFKSGYFILCNKDYITNLQEENKELKAELEMYENGVYFSSENDELQQRIDKAIEYIDKELSFNVIINGKENKVIAYNKAFENIRNILESSDEQ